MTEDKEYRALLAGAERLLSDRTNAAAHDRIKLRDAVCAFLDAERARGVSIQAVQRAVEEILKRAEDRAGDRADGHRELAQQMIDWCIKLDQTQQTL